MAECMRTRTVATGLLATVLCAQGLWLIRWSEDGSHPPPQQANPFLRTHNLTRGFVIAMEASGARTAVDGASRYLGIESVQHVEGVNGTDAMLWTELPLYTRVLMRYGRHDHMQLSNAGMLGCLLSHVAVWRRVEPGETVAVFEEDATFDMASSERFKTLSQDLAGVPWELLVLECGQFIATGEWEHLGQSAARCAQNSTEMCTWFGTRGYLLTHAGAQRLLANAEPISVQVDALMALVAAYDGSFRMFWTRAEIAHQNPFHVSKVWDGCIKCFLPSASLSYVWIALAWVLSLVAVSTLTQFNCSALKWS